jgi:hypothetical protein
MPDRERINAAFLPMAIAAGLTSAITNPMAVEVKAAIMAADVLMGHDQDAGRWIRAHRAAAAVSAAALSAPAVSAAGLFVPPGGSSLNGTVSPESPNGTPRVASADGVGSGSSRPRINRRALARADGPAR